MDGYSLDAQKDKLYNTFSEVEQRDFMKSFIERIDIYPEKLENGCWIRNIVFNFPMPVIGNYCITLGIGVNSRDGSIDVKYQRKELLNDGSG